MQSSNWLIAGACLGPQAIFKLKRFETIASVGNSIWHLLYVASLLIGVLSSPATFAQSAATAEQPVASGSDPYVGVVADSTVTFIGQEFYRAFSAAWREFALSDRYAIGIFERPSARLGSLVWVEFGNQRIYSVYLSLARKDAIRQTAAAAAQIAYRNVLDLNANQLLFKDPDLGPAEM